MHQYCVLSRKNQVAVMANRIKEMRQLMFSKLRQKKTEGKWDHILQQIGMFSFTGLTRKSFLPLSVSCLLYCPLLSVCRSASLSLFVGTCISMAKSCPVVNQFNYIVWIVYTRYLSTFFSVCIAVARACWFSLTVQLLSCMYIKSNIH